MHAEAYPDIWYGIWSGPDTYNSVLSKYPGQTQFGEPPVDGKKSPTDWGVNWTDFPVMNMHSHAWPLYSTAKLLGVDFHEDGVRFNPAIPHDEYEFSSPLLGFKKTRQGYSGWYAPTVAGRWSVEIKLAASEAKRVREVKINGKREPLSASDQTIRFAGESAPGKPLAWKLAEYS